MDPASEQKLDVATMIIQLQKMLPQTVSWGAQAEQQLAVTHTHLARSRRRVPDAPEPAAGWTDDRCGEEKTKNGCYLCVGAAVAGLRVGV